MPGTEQAAKINEIACNTIHSSKKDSAQFAMLKSALQMITTISRNDGKNLPEKIDSIKVIAETAIKSTSYV